MRRTAALAAVSLALCSWACGSPEPPMPRACVDTSRADYERALTAAPGTVRLPGDVPISACTRHVKTDADLQNLGVLVHTVAERLATRARAGDARAALQLGYLSGAIGAGADRSNGVAAELARRVETTSAVLVDGPATVTAALARGAAAGRAGG
ncbi:MAG TPA: hypothetical protein VFG42_17840 [Baekduia sp.]|uniref:hypothetical protein n=1 Tax=Baekduia sp. TaxID=2600305 RepID=UPI002D777835|nr:hypothetical protein [Baekduia sp.]HET6508660.1 hypothetical protein [Baekduia sp.]